MISHGFHIPQNSGHHFDVFLKENKGDTYTLLETKLSSQAQKIVSGKLKKYDN